MLQNSDINQLLIVKRCGYPISQSGETADTMAAIKLAKSNTFVFGVCNVVGSSISRETHMGLIHMPVLK
jgi:glucosamine--fructose-6-phosphate aminotransferase (isomerizing)